MKNSLDDFFKSEAYGVVGASNNREKFGNKVLRCYLQHHKKVYPVNPQEKMIEGLPALPSVINLPAEVLSISIITPPPVTEKIVKDAIQVGIIKNIWMQPGAESKSAIDICQQHDINVIANGACILQYLGFRDI